MPADTASIARAQQAYGRQAADAVPTCGRGFVTLVDRETAQVIFIPMRCHRWECSYCAPYRLRDLQSRARRGHPERHIVLTSRPKPERTFAQNAKWIRQRFAILVTKIRRTFGPFEYMAALEQHKNGAPHLHILCRGRYIPHRWLATAWSKLTGNFIVHIKAVDRTRAAVNELTKYLAKTAAALTESGGTTTPISTSNNWLLDPPERDPAHAERHWDACYTPFDLGDLEDVLQFLGRSLELLPNAHGMFTLEQRAPPTPAEIDAAEDACPYMLMDLLQFTLGLCAGETSSTRAVRSRGEMKDDRAAERRQLAYELAGAPA